MPASDQDRAMIQVRDARVHNLRGVDVDLPRDALVVFTGVSGSGKSSLAFDTIYAEAQRRYFESIAPYARRLIQQVGTPRVGAIEHLPPAVAIEQRRGAPGSRSSVGTVTTIGNLVRMLFSRAGSYPTDAPERLDSDAFSPNTAAGACPVCHGLGQQHEPTEASMVRDPSLSIREGAVSAWPGAWQGKNQRDILDVLGYDVDVPWSTLPQSERDWILFTEEQPVVTVVPVREVYRTHRPYQGQFMSARRYIMRALTMSQSAAQRRRALEFVETQPCPSCGGARLRADALAVTIAGLSIAQLGALPIREAAQLLRPIAARGAADTDAGAGIAAQIVERIDALVELGLGYLALDRPAPTLSAGELQRLRLASQLRSGLFGVAYVLDEPSAGLHPADARALLAMLHQLKERGNSLLVVEHHMDVATSADWIVDVGPGAGTHGGRVLYSGPVAGLGAVADSVTRRFLPAALGGGGETVAEQGAPRTPTDIVTLEELTGNNLRGASVELPLGALTAVTGVSGAGKSTLVGLLADHFEGGADERIARVVRVDQQPIGRTPRSNLATYTGLFDGVRKLFAATEEARERGYKAGRFSFNVVGGRCETCEGEGFVAVELMFLPGTYAPCETCGGTRYNPETLEVRWNDLTIADVLALTVEDAVEVFAGERGIARSLQTLADIGLGYLTLGQPATELSGGEAQRIKLATELQRARRGRVLYVLDEPTTGLHPADVQLLMRQLQRLVDAGNAVVVVEHDMSVVASADHVIDLGPGGGDQGGRVVAAGTPADVAASLASATAPYLAAALTPS